MNESVGVRDDGKFRYVTINRSDKVNALSIDMMRRLAEAISLEEARPDVEAIVLSGKGNKGLCAGADISELRTRRDEQYDALRHLVMAFAQAPVPVICVAHGLTLGAGCLMPLLSDIVLAAADATLGFPEMEFGMYPAFMHAILLEKFPTAVVYRLCMAARQLTALEAVALGLFTEMVPSDQFAQRVHERVAFYGERLPAIQIGRQLRTQFVNTSLIDRINQAEKLISRNLALPEVGVMLARYLK